jgi:EAL and modified HD-GYP domain-containing signal transduction protein
MESSLTPLFLHLLADRKLTAGGVRLIFSDESPDALSLIAGLPDFVKFAAAFTCLIAAGQAARLPAELLQTLLNAGCKILDDKLVHRSDAASKPVLPASALWLDGDWFMAPPAKPTGSQSASRTLALKLVQLVVADADTRELEAVFRQDPTLSYHLLRLVNSLGMGLSRRITSFSQAILILGRSQLRRWLNLMLFAARNDDHRSAMLLARVAVRAHGMELLARDAGLDRSAQELAFMTGMFSLLGVLFGLPLPEVLKPLQISEDMVAALLQHEGEIGQLLQLIKLAEQSDSSGVLNLLSGLQITPEQFNLRAIQSHQWMIDVISDAQGGAHA